jgi:hypothetical protein
MHGKGTEKSGAVIRTNESSKGEATNERAEWVGKEDKERGIEDRKMNTRGQQSPGRTWCLRSSLSPTFPSTLSSPPLPHSAHTTKEKKKEKKKKEKKNKNENNNKKSTCTRTCAQRMSH